MKHTKPPSAETIRAALLARAEKFCEKRDTSFSAICRAAVNDGKFLTGVRNGRDFTLGTYQRVNDWLDQQEGAR